MTGRPTNAFLILACSAYLARPSMASETRLAREAIAEQNDVARAARSQLRSMGPPGLALLFEENSHDIEAMRESLAAGARIRPEWERLRAALDAVARQRDAAWSGLYWYTDLGAAKAAAARAGRPILSLRLLGNLDEELSCANSRFFRTVLYANAAISDELRNNWILHWESVRPVPKITIDFGDGRKLERTITGNSLHYVLAANGSLADVLPGLWGPKEFLQEIRQARERSPAGDSSPFEEDLPNAMGRRETARTDETDRSGAIPSSSVLDASSLQLMRVKTRGAGANSFARTLRNFERSLAADTAANRSLRRTIHEWLRQAPAPADLAALTNRIYDELFLTPRTDPWLGLVAVDTYNAIEGDPGVAATAAKPPDALRAGGRALSKMIAERPALTALAPPKR
jgi:hypothetical protein